MTDSLAWPDRGCQEFFFNFCGGGPPSFHAKCLGRGPHTEAQRTRREEGAVSERARRPCRGGCKGRALCILFSGVSVARCEIFGKGPHTEAQRGSRLCLRVLIAVRLA
jgi:hypothetical protein